MTGSSASAPLSVVAFVGPETLPLHVAVAQGYYQSEGLEVRYEAATGSIDQMVRLIEGDCDIVMTAMDNVIAYNVGQGGVVPEALPNPLPVLVAFLGCASEPRPLVARSDITALAGLHGARIAVDALNTGFSFLLRQCLENAGLGREEYTLVPVGAPPARWQSLQDGDCAAALLSRALAATAVSAGFTEVRIEPDPWAGYQGGVFAARQDWIAHHPDHAARFIRATLAATGWVLDPTNQGLLPGLLRAHLPHMTAAAAEDAADGLPGLLKLGLPIDEDGLRTVLALRQKYGEPPVRLADARAYLDLSPYDAVMASRRSAL